jgi:hypothetical protein
MQPCHTLAGLQCFFTKSELPNMTITGPSPENLTLRTLSKIPGFSPENVKNERFFAFFCKNIWIVTKK